MKICCDHCGKRAEKVGSQANRSRKLGWKLYCDRRCAGLARRKYIAKAVKVERKRLYDIEYRRKNLTEIKAKKRAYFQRTYDPAKAAIERQKTMARHIAYCRRPEYREWKHSYDSRYRARRLFGPFAESFLLLQEIEKEVACRMSKYDIAINKGYYNKAQTRRREYERLIRG